MTKVRLYPHRVADPESVAWGEWWLEEEGARTPLPSLLKGWDYAATLRLGRSVAIDPDLLRNSTGISDLSQVEVVAQVDCNSTQFRRIARLRLPTSSAGHEHHLSLDIAPGEVAREIRLSSHLVLGAPRPRQEDRSAYAKGARLNSAPTQSLALEGDAARFPTDAMAFSHAYLPFAPWTLMTHFDDVRDSFLATIRLVINTEHPVGESALDPRTAEDLAPLLRTDTVRQLVANLAPHLEELERSTAEEGSVADVTEKLARNLLGISIASLVRTYRDDPQRFELLLHERLSPTDAVMNR